MAHSEYTSRRPLEGTGGAVPVLLRVIPAGKAFNSSYFFHPWGAIDRGKDGQEWGLSLCVPPSHNSSK